MIRGCTAEPPLRVSCLCWLTDEEALEDGHDVERVEVAESEREEVQLRENAEEHADEEDVRHRVHHLVVAANRRPDHLGQLSTTTGQQQPSQPDAIGKALTHSMCDLCAQDCGPATPI